MKTTILVSAGEASADRMAALTLSAAPSAGLSLNAFGLGGLGCQRAGMDVTMSLSDIAIMGWLPVARKAWAVQRTFRGILKACEKQNPAVALLVGFTSFNQVLGKHLKARGIPVLWCAAPQVWAWRPRRLITLARSVDCLAVLFPFEKPLWKQAGYDVHLVGHPAWDSTHPSSEKPSMKRLAILPGSRDQEVRAMAVPFFHAARRWKSLHPDAKAEAIISPSLSRNTETWLRKKAKSSGISPRLADPLLGAAPVWQDYSLALCTSGTATLEAALAGVPPVIGYRCDALTALIARQLLLTPYIGLPNILLEREAFPELIQGRLRPESLVDALVGLENDSDARKACSELRNRLEVKDGKNFGERMADLLKRLLSTGARVQKRKFAPTEI